MWNDATSFRQSLAPLPFAFPSPGVSVGAMSDAPDGDKGKSKGRGSGRSGPGKSEASLLQALLDEAAKHGAKLEGWRCVVRPRPNGTGSDPYYISPDGKRYRSRQEVRRVVALKLPHSL